MKACTKHITFLITLAACIVAIQPLSAQNYQESISIGDEAMKENDFYTASVYYNNALWFDSTDIELAYKCAGAYRLFNNYPLAAQWYKYVINHDFQKRHPLARFWLACMQKSSARYAEAGENFQIFYNENKNSADEYFIKKSLIEIQACRDAPLMIAERKNVMIEHLPEGKINTQYSEFNAIQLSDTAMVFSALRPVLEGEFDTYFANAYIAKVYIAQAGVAGWTKVRELDPRINDRENNTANICFSNDVSKAFFTRTRKNQESSLKSDIFICKNTDGKWQKPEKLPNKINIPGFTSTHPFFAETPDYDILFFVSDRPGGIGNLDIWYSILKDDKFQDPINLGSIINTPGDDITPFYHSPTAQLYFSSDWHKGLGGFDIFYSKGLLNTWETPKNIGFPVNSSCNDMYFSVTGVDNDGFFTSNRSGSIYLKSETCCNDIYSYEWQDTTTIKPFIEIVSEDTITIEESINLMLPLTLYFHNDEPDPKTRYTSTKKNYQNLLDEYYGMKDIYMEEYSKGLSGTAKTKAQKDIEDFFENYVGRGFSQLKLFAKLLLLDLDKGNIVRIKIKGYCSPLTTTEYNLNLAKRRISSIVNFLKEYNGGVFIPYLNASALNGASLTILEEPLGESTAGEFVSDNPNDKRNSIYSRAAAFERKIQIILYESDNAASDGLNKYPCIVFTDSVHDFGSLETGKKAVFNFEFVNTGNAPLLLGGIETSCGCTVADWPRESLDPGQKASISIFFNTTEDYGSHKETITVYSNDPKGKSILTIRAFILPPP